MGFVDHPVVPARPSYRKIGDLAIAGTGKKEKIAACRAVQCTPLMCRRSKPVLPAFGEFERTRDIHIPAPAEQNKFIFQFYSLLCGSDKIRHEDHVCIDDTKCFATALLAGQLKHG